jgi:hypothetical protein
MQVEIKVEVGAAICPSSSKLKPTNAVAGKYGLSQHHYCGENLHFAGEPRRIALEASAQSAWKPKLKFPPIRKAGPVSRNPPPVLSLTRPKARK